MRSVGWGLAAYDQLFKTEKKKYLSKNLRLVVFSKTDIPFATCVFNSNEVWEKPEWTRTTVTLYNKKELELRFIKNEVYKATYFRIYLASRTEIDDYYIWQGNLDFPRWCSGRGKGSRMRFVPGDLRIKWS
jgi:hypothetical protein